MIDRLFPSAIQVVGAFCLAAALLQTARAETNTEESIAAQWIFLGQCARIDPAKADRAKQAFRTSLYNGYGIDAARFEAALRSPSSRELQRLVAQEDAAPKSASQKAQDRQHLEELCLEFEENFKPIPAGEFLWNNWYWAHATLPEVQHDIRPFKTSPMVLEQFAGWTPLVIAAGSSPSADAVQAVLDAWGGMNHAVTGMPSEDDGMTALMAAAQSNEHAQVTALLLRAGANVHARSTNGRTPLIWAARSNFNPKVTQMLLAAGADVNAQDDDGKTALIWALQRNQSPQVIQALLGSHPNLALRDKQGKTAEDALHNTEIPALQASQAQLQRLMQAVGGVQR